MIRPHHVSVERHKKCWGSACKFCKENKLTDHPHPQAMTVLEDYFCLLRKGMVASGGNHQMSWRLEHECFGLVLLVGNSKDHVVGAEFGPDVEDTRALRHIISSAIKEHLGLLWSSTASAKSQRNACLVNVVAYEGPCYAVAGIA
eukprot:3695636-Amphidinium_carterae.1